MNHPRPEWTTGLSQQGVYYEGYTEKLAELLTAHSVTTISTYGVRRSRRPGGSSHSDQDSLDQSTTIGTDHLTNPKESPVSTPSTCDRNSSEESPVPAPSICDCSSSPAPSVLFVYFSVLCTLHVYSTSVLLPYYYKNKSIIINY